MHSSTNEPSEGAALVASRVCSVEGCEERSRRSTGWCDKHHSRWKRHGNPLTVLICEWVDRDSSGRPSCIHGPAVKFGKKWGCPKKLSTRRKVLYDMDHPSRGKTQSKINNRKRRGWYDEGGMATKPLRVKELT